ncbi:MAG TPA: tetratricopeptide repeat protein, partial [Thermoanaerobaculia bacterium]
HDYIELFNRGKFLFAKGDLPGALKIFQDAEQQRRDDPAAVYNQAVAFEKLGDFLKATDRYRRYLEINQSASDKAAVNQRIFALETEIEDMRTMIVCTFCGEKLPRGSTWCHRCWNGPYLTTAARWNTRVCGTGATAVRSTSYADGRVAKNEDLSCTLRGVNFLQSLLYTPTKQKEIQNRRKSEGWTYTNGVISSRTDPQGSQVKLEQGDSLQRILSLTTGEVLSFAAQKSQNGLWLLEREETIIDGQKYVKSYSFDSAGRIAQERVVYQNSSGCNHVITVLADYVYDNDTLTSVKLRSAYDGLQSEGLPQTRWEGVLTYTYDASGRVEKEDFVVSAHTKTFMNKPSGKQRDETGKIYPGWKVKKPTDILKRGDLCRLSGTNFVGNAIDLRPFYTISPNIAMVLPYGVNRIAVTFTYPEGFAVASR